MGYPYNDNGSIFDNGGQSKAYGMVSGLITPEQVEKLLGVKLTKSQLRDPKFSGVVARLRAVADETEKLLKEIENSGIPEEPKGSYASGGNVMIAFTKKYSGSQCYHYLAIKPHGKDAWTITGRPSMGTNVSWEKLVEFIKKDETDPEAALFTLRTLRLGDRLVK